MLAPDVLAPLEELPLTTIQLARETVLAGRRLIQASAADLDAQSATPQALLALRRAMLELRFYLARQHEEIIFFVAKQRQPSTLRPLAARLQISLQATASESPADEPATSQAAGTAAAPPSAAACHYRLIVPSFLVIRPTGQELALYAPAGTTAENGLLLRLGEGGRHVLGIRNPEAEQRAAAVFTTQSQQPLSSWSTEPFLELTETLRAWLANGMTAVQEVDMVMPTEPRLSSDVHAAVSFLAAAYQSLEAELARAQAQPLPPWLSAIVPHYATQEFVADINLCLDRQGRFATPTERQSISLELHVTIAKELGRPVVRLLLGPPDFLIAGELHSAFREQLRQYVAPSLLKAVGALDAGRWAEFVDSATARMVIFRVGRDKNSDIDTVVLPGRWRDSERTLVVRTTATVDMSAHPVRVKLTATELSYDSQKSNPQTLDGQTLTYFMRLAGALKDWINVLR